MFPQILQRMVLIIDLLLDSGSVLNWLVPHARFSKHISVGFFQAEADFGQSCVVFYCDVYFVARVSGDGAGASMVVTLTQSGQELSVLVPEFLRQSSIKLLKELGDSVGFLSPGRTIDPQQLLDRTSR
jgi:hypothetical protein